jgi:hypothetical protein
VQIEMQINKARNTPHAIARDSEALVLSLLDRLQQSLASTTRRPQQILNEIRRMTLNQQDLVRACVSAVRDVVACKQIDVDPNIWKEFFDLAPERQHLPDRDPRRKLRALASLTAIWGMEVVEHYGWKLKDTKNLELFRRCALAYPDFEDFSKIANIVMLRRHEHSLFNARTPSIGYKPRGPPEPSPFTLQDLQILSQFATKKDGIDSQHGRLLTTQSLDDEKELSRVREWSNCSDGALMIGDQALYTLRPQQYHRYLLEVDRFGVLCPAENRAETGSQKASKRGGDSISPLRAKVQRTNADRPSFPNLLQGKHDQRSVVGTTCDMNQPNVKAIPLGIRIGSEDASQPTTSSDCSSDADDGRQLDSLAEAASSQVLASDWNGVRRPTTEHTDFVSSDRSHDEVGSKSSPHDLRARRNSTLEDNRVSNDRSIFQFWQQTRDHSLSSASPDMSTNQSDLHEAFLPNPDHTSIERCADQNRADKLHMGLETVLSVAEAQSMTSERSSGSTTFTGSDPSIRNIVDRIVFPSGICDTEKVKLQHWADIAYETEDQAPHPILKHWLHPIQFASVHTVADTEEVIDADENMYDVLEISWNLFKSRAGRGEIFSTPLLIKETFADADEFSVRDYADRLEQTFPGMEVIVRYHMSEPEPLPVSEAARLFRTLHGNVLPNAPNFLDLESSSNAIKPGLTRLPRYRLLDALVRGAKANYTGRLGKKTYLTPFDVGSCQSFEILGLRGAFSGAHMDALGGTWLRNLFGTKLWMIVPERLMTDQDWIDFSKAGPGWNPGKKSRAIILGPGDVFFMPPGTRVIHAVLTLETCLMDGGMLWDDVTLLPLLQSIYWIGRNQKATNEALPFQLGEVLNQLESGLDQVVGITRFGDAAGLLKAIRDLRSLGCECDLCDDTCPCSQEGRRCTPLCNDHLMGTRRECFEEPRCEESDGAGSLYGGDD